MVDRLERQYLVPTYIRRTSRTSMVDRLERHALLETTFLFQHINREDTQKNIFECSDQCILSLICTYVFHIMNEKHIINYRPSFAKRLHQLIVTLYTLSIYSSVHNQCERFSKDGLYQSEKYLFLLEVNK